MTNTPGEQNSELLPMGDQIPPDTKVQMSEATLIASMALNLSLKYHDTNMVKDGSLYQQYKIEGKNFSPLHIDMVLDTATVFEEHIMKASERMAAIAMDVIMETIEELDDKSEGTDNEEESDDG